MRDPTNWFNAFYLSVDVKAGFDQKNIVSNCKAKQGKYIKPFKITTIHQNPALSTSNLLVTMALEYSVGHSLRVTVSSPKASMPHFTFLANPCCCSSPGPNFEMEMKGTPLSEFQCCWCCSLTTFLPEESSGRDHR